MTLNESIQLLEHHKYWIFTRYRLRQGGLMHPKRHFICFSMFVLASLCQASALFPDEQKSLAPLVEGVGTAAAADILQRYNMTIQGLRQQLRAHQHFDDPIAGAPQSDAVLSDGFVSSFWGKQVKLSDRFTEDEESLIRTAGVIHAENCADLLLNRITIVGRIDIRPRIRIIYLQHCPAFDSLVLIGKRSCQAAISRLPLEPDELTRVFMVGLLQTCLGDADARALLVRKAETICDDVQRTRMEEAIAQVDDGPCPESLRAYYNSKHPK